MSDIAAIKNYILFLKNKCGLQITLHPLKEENLILQSELHTFNIHDNSYCVYIKTCPEAQHHCISRQNKVLEKCIDGSYCGICYAGVKEYIYPIIGAENNVGFISVSGYKCDDHNSYILSVSEKYTLQYDKLVAVYDSLKDSMPKKEEVDTLIRPLQSMLELAYIKEQNIKPDIKWLDNVIRYIKKYHTKNITIDDIAAHFSCSRSRISHAFKSETSKSFREYLTELRIEDARSLLMYTNLSMTEIAYSVGFGDSTYFSNVFKKTVGVSPSEFRKNKKE